MTRALGAMLAISLLLAASVADARVPLRKTFARGLECGPDGTARLHGTVDAGLAPRLSLTRAGARIRSARAVATLSGAADLAVEASGGASCELPDTPLASWYAPPIRFAVGPVPVLVIPKITIYASAEARAAAPLTTRVHGTFTATAGLRYDGRAHRIGRFAQHLSADPPSVRSHASAAVRLTPSLELRVYGLAGPRFDFGTGLEFESGPPPAVSVPVRLTAALRLPGIDVAPVTVLSRSIPLRRRSVASDESEPVERARVEWDTAADVDLHVWDANGRHTWFRESGVPGLLLSKDDTDGFGPEIVEDERPGRGLTYGVCLFEARGAGQTMVTTHLAGRPARTATLRAEGDSAVVTGDFAPPSGWCQPRH